MSPLRWLLARYRPARTGLLLSLFLALLTLWSGMLLLGLSGWFITASAVAGLTSMAAAVSFNLLWPSSGIRALAVSRTLSRYFERLVSHQATFQVMQDLRTRLFGQLLPRLPGPLSRLTSGELLQRFLGDVERLEQSWLGMAQPLLAALFTALLLAGLTGWLTHWGAGLALLGLWALLAAALARTARTSVLPLQRQALQRDQLRRELIQALQGLPEVISLHQRPLLAARWGSLLSDLSDQETRLARLQARTGNLLQSALQAVAVLLILVLGPLVVSGALQAALLIAAVLLTLGALDAVQPLAGAAQRWTDTRQSAARLQELEQSPIALSPCVGQAQPQAPRRLVLSGLHWAWPGQSPLFESLSAEVRPGAPLVITGPSGSGKSTLLHALAGLQAVDGEIRLDDWRQQDCDEHAWRRQFALLQQRPHLFTGSLRDNLRQARPGLTDEALWQALSQVGLEDLVRQRGGLELWVGPEGLHLSGGQARRLALAQVLLRGAPVLLLDEPFSGLDQPSIERLVPLLQALSEDHMLVLVTHDPRHTESFAQHLSIGERRLA